MINLAISIKALYALTIIVKFSSTQDIIGCGGFIQADGDVKLDLTQIKVKLLTDYGSVKYTTEPAPNGYYMIPVYEKGEYQIQIQPKSGWNFEPSGAIKLDLEACERNEDINFVFTGFQISGQVLSGGTDSGPSDIAVSLMASDKDVQKVKTTEGGRYTFNNVLPGKYSIKATHKNLIFSKSEVEVTVGNDVPIVSQSPTIHGYSVTGSITNEGQAVKGVVFILKHDSNQNVDVKGCIMGSPPNYNQQGAICYVASNEAGKFKFQSVPVGKYSVVPFHRGEKTVFDVAPSKLSLDVTHSSLTLQKEFTVSGFGVSGQVKYSTKGKGVEGAVVSLDGRDVTRTDQYGSYAIDGMKSGKYTISVKAASVYFDDVAVDVVPSAPQLSLITPSSFDLCGKIVLDSSKIRDITVSIFHTTKSHIEHEVTVGVDGLFCVQVKPGTYTVKPLMKHRASSLTLTPAFVKVTVSDSPISHESVRFSQFKAVLSGRVMCMANCGDVKVVLKAKASDVQVQSQTVTSMGSSVAFVFQGVVPGEYSVSAIRPRWCWAHNSVSITVDETNISDILLQQKGYEAVVESSHATGLKYVKTTQGSKNKQPKKVEEGEFQIAKGTNELCLPSVGKFELSPLSCHVFDKTSYTFDTDSSEAAIRILAVKHSVLFKLTSEQAVSDVSLTIRVGDAEQDVKMPATKAKDAKHGSELERQFDVSVERFSVDVSSSTVLFPVESYSVTVNSAECPAAVVEIEAYKGRFVHGAVTPPIGDLEVHLYDGERIIKSGVTDQKGQYRFGPLPNDGEYSIAAEKHGYILAKDDENSFNFKAFKLAEVSVRVEDDRGNKLAGVILSLSGNAYRSNNRTGESGDFSFIGLSPGMYYLKAILKEYEFSPASVEVQVKEGATENVRVLGKRIAYSCVGSVVNLRSAPVSHPIVVRVVGLSGEDCVNTEESSQAEPDGHFRVRGLKPGCSYSLKLAVGSSSDNTVLYRASRESTTINMKADNVDVGKIMVVESLAQTDVAVFIDTPTQYLSTLKVILAREGSPNPSQTISLENSKVTFFNSLPMDSSKYRVYLESSLSKKLYDYELSENLFTADSPSKPISLKFVPQIKTKIEYEVKESSILALVVVALSTLLVFNKDKVLNLVLNKAN